MRKMSNNLSNRIGLELLCREYPRVIEKPLVKLGFYLTQNWGK